MTPSICLTFKIHQPAQLKLYRFFDIGKDSHYYDDFADRSAIRKAAYESYIPMNRLILELAKSTKGKLKVAFAITGTALEMMDRYCPEALDSFKEVYDAGCAEFICEPFYHSLAAVNDPTEFEHQVKKHMEAIEHYFGVVPTTFVNTDMIYNDNIGEQVSSLGINTVITEGARHILGWRSPNYVYKNVFKPKVKLLLRNPSLSDDLALRFSDRSWNEWPLTAEKYYGWIKQAKDDQVINLCMNYKVFGEYNGKDTGIFNFFEAFVKMVVADKTFSFEFPAKAASGKAVDSLEVQDFISSEDEERDLAKWLGNELQKDAFDKMSALREKLSLINLPQLWEDYGHLMASDHFYYMNTKFFTDCGPHRYINPYDTPYEAFINYMNVLADFALRVENELN